MSDRNAGARAEPYFSVLITAFNRAGQIARCVRSCTMQSDDDFEVVVVDDGSTDDTIAVLEEFDEPRLRIVRHDRNRGQHPTRATAFDHSHGEWIVMLDSDDELLPHALARLRQLIEDLAPGVRVIRFRHRLDDGTVSPARSPAGVTDYDGRLAWLESVVVDPVSTDAGHCMHRSVLEANNYFRHRRGEVEALWELNLARRERSLWVEDVLGLVHADAPNQYYGRSQGAEALVARLLRDAPDQLWMFERLLDEHGSVLADRAPHYWQKMLDGAAREALLAGHRIAGARHAAAALRAGAPPIRTLVTVLVGLVGPRALAHAKVGNPRWRVKRSRDAVAQRPSG